MHVCSDTQTVPHLCRREARHLGDAHAGTRTGEAFRYARSAIAGTGRLRVAGDRGARVGIGIVGVKVTTGSVGVGVEDVARDGKGGNGARRRSSDG